MKLTGRGAGLLLAVPLLFAAGHWWGFTLLRVIAGGAVAALMLAVVAARRPPCLRVRREALPELVDRGQAAVGGLVVSNRSSRTVPARLLHERVVGGRDIAVPLPTLPPDAAARCGYALPTERRGRIVLGPLRIRHSDPLGLAQTVAGVGGQAVLWVRPRVHGVHRLSGGRGARHSGVATGTPLLGSADFRSLREYVVGDEPRHLHWKSTARTGQLMVREFTDPQRPRLVVLLDNRRDVLCAAAFEEAVEVAASLAQAALADDHAVRLAAVAGTGVDTGTGATARRITEWLCVTVQSDPSPGSPSPHLLMAAEGAGSQLVFITGRRSAGDLPSLAAARRRWARLIVINLAPAEGRPTGGAASRGRRRSPRERPTPGRHPVPTVPGGHGSAGATPSAEGLTVVEAGSAIAAVAGWNAAVSR